MKYSFADNGWAVIVDTPIQEITDNDIHDITKFMINNVAVVWKKQNLTLDDQENFCKRFGNLQEFFNREHWVAMSDAEVGMHAYPDNPGIVRVTGEPDESDQIGLFGHDEELAWHNNKPFDEVRKPFIWLHAEKGSAGSVTHWTNQMLAWEKLSAKQKEYFETLEIQFGDNRKYVDQGSAHAKARDLNVPNQLSKNLWHKLVVTNPYGKKGLNITPYQTHAISGMSHEEMIKFTDEMIEYLSQPEFVYTHHWEDGDVVLGEQVTSVHKRDTFKGMNKRVMSRIAFSPDKIFPNGLHYEGYNGVLA